MERRTFSIAKAAGTLLVLCAVASLASSVPTFTTLVNFNYPSEGGLPYSTLVQGSDGNFYGMTLAGGITADCQGSGCGTVFQMTPGGTLTTIYEFDGAVVAGSFVPLLQGTDGNFYSTGGTSPTTYGAFFNVTPQGTLTVLYSFCALAHCADGYAPQGALVQGIDGNFYGVTGAGAFGSGTVFRMTPQGGLTTLYSFCPAGPACTDGRSSSGLVPGSDGNYYGTTQGGGAYNNGTVFRITPQGVLTTIYSFCAQTNCPDGTSPSALVLASDGDFYGTTFAGGISPFCPSAYTAGCGTVFKITPQGVLTTLYSFCTQTNCADGNRPEAPLIQATDGNLYGTTFSGGISAPACGGCGTVFSITPSGTLTTLHAFDFTDGDQIGPGVVQGIDGNFYERRRMAAAQATGPSIRFPWGLVRSRRLRPSLQPLESTPRLSPSRFPMPARGPRSITQRTDRFPRLPRPLTAGRSR